MTGKILCAVAALLLLTSCKELMSDIISSAVETEVDAVKQGLEGINNVSKADKQAAKERDELKKKGICPVCRGKGMTIDGRYTCGSCNGTGKVQK